MANIKKLDQKTIDQIAAGEIIHRPSFVLKELLENSIDAKSNNIKIKIENAGKKLIQVKDDGEGMSEKNCIKCFEKHATSKINKTEDLWNIRTLGFRGEALYAISAVSKVEVTSKNKSKELGTRILRDPEGIKLTEKHNCNKGTIISVKNLFYNTPARRKFLKSDLIENKYTVKTFINIALTNENISFDLDIDGKKIFSVKKQNRRQRIASLIKKNINEHIIPIKENTDIIKVDGFIGKPEFAKKNKNEQYIFLNKRHIKNNHINKALTKSYEGLIKDSNPIYFIFLEVNESRVDVNIHPTKNEVKFEDEKPINKIIYSAARRSLGQYNMSPSFNFEQERAFNIKPKIQKTISVFSSVNKQKKSETSLEDFKNIYNVKEVKQHIDKTLALEHVKELERNVSQLQNKFILVINEEKIIIIHQERAHQRILYEHFKYSDYEIKSQKILYPQIIELNHEEFIIISQIKKELEDLGFNVVALDENRIEINGIPNDNREYNINFIIERIIQDFKETGIKNVNIKNQISNLLAKQMSIKSGQKLQKEEINIIVEEIFNCKSNQITPDGKKIMQELSLEQIKKYF